ncbi:unnamed protein product [Ceratitis capitata]|uniref:(Mediterranean fruit fly) hypothetical protein n=1 Tax=Ceratitis capitata TaxID=7213 RepID=A0A811VC14_CERCA|nr:unnamed protein product [Ceratitis capitata]
MLHMQPTSTVDCSRPYCVGGGGGSVTVTVTAIMVKPPATNRIETCNQIDRHGKPWNCGWNFAL